MKSVSRRSRLTLLLVAVGALVAWAVVALPDRTGPVDLLVQANGAIVYDAGGNIRVANPDGSNDTRVIGRVEDDLYQHCPAYSPDGRFVAHLQGFPQHDLVITPVDARGRPIGRMGAIRVFEGSTLRCGEWSADGRFIALVGVTERDSQLLVVDVVEGSVRVAAAVPIMPAAVWSPDGEALAYPVGQGISVLNVAGGDDELLVTRVPPIEIAWSPDGSLFAFTGIPVGKDSPDVFFLDRDGRDERPVTDSDAHETRLAWSPTGTHLAVVQESCKNARPCPWQITIFDRNLVALRLAGPVLPGGEAAEVGAFGPPVWAPDGNSILFSLLVWSDGAPDPEIPLVVVPLAGGQSRVVTEEFGIDTYDWQGLPR